MPSWNCVVHIEVTTEGCSKCYETKKKKGHKIFSNAILKLVWTLGKSRHRWDDNSKIYIKKKAWEWRLAKNLLPVNQNTLHHVLKDYNLKPLKLYVGDPK